MRPGPGLVVMALAFISGARRGSSTSESTITTTTTIITSTSTTTATATTSAAAASQHRQQQQQLDEDEEEFGQHYYHHQEQPNNPSNYFYHQPFTPNYNVYYNSNSYYNNLFVSNLFEDTSYNSKLVASNNNNIHNRRDINNNNNKKLININKNVNVNVNDNGIGDGNNLNDDNVYKINSFGSAFIDKISDQSVDRINTGPPLTRINPWLSACDLAHPNQAPDLQGQCSAGSLPVAWVDEGPGPPKCPISCVELERNTKNNKLNNDNNKYNNNNNMKLNNFNNNNQNNKYKNNNNNNNNFNTMDNLKNLKADDDQWRYQLSAESDYMQQNQKQHQQQHQHQKTINNKQQQQQCLDYLGDKNDTMPMQLCKKSQSELANLLRSLRLKHCCERNVFSALHTFALNATLSGGNNCVRTLTDILELDSLASRITCEFTEILVRYDCRQVYSLIHHCEDCKEAYRRWVCSTLIPYFAEPADIRRNSTGKTTGNNITTKLTSNSSSNQNINNKDINNNLNNKNSESTSSRSTRENSSKANKNSLHINNNLNLINSNNNNNNNNNKNLNNYNRVRTKRESSSTDSNHLPLQTNINNLNININNNNYNNYRHDAKFVADRRDEIKNIDIINNNNNNNNDENEINKDNDIVVDDVEMKTNKLAIKRKVIDEVANSPHFISTAIKDPIAKDPVIARELKRSKRKETREKHELRKRRRIRPCLSVCQTVEKKCPYMLPADRAPALPTQYAGEPTFLCLDPNIPETGEQLRKSNNGPPNCCFRYCGSNPIDGVCAYCDEFRYNLNILTKNSSNNNNNKTLTSPTSKLHHFTTIPNGTITIAQATTTTTTTTTTPTSLIISDLKNLTNIENILKNYAKIDKIYYYDDDPNDIPTIEQIVICTNYQDNIQISSNNCTPLYLSSSSNKLIVTKLFNIYYYLIIIVTLWYLVNNLITIKIFIINIINNWYLKRTNMFVKLIKLNNIKIYSTIIIVEIISNGKLLVINKKNFKKNLLNLKKYLKFSILIESLSKKL